MRLYPFLTFLFLILGTTSLVNAQTVTIHGQVIHAEDPTFNLLIVNKTTSQGVFGNESGDFHIKVDKADTLLIGALGYKTRKVCVVDSAQREEYNIRIYLERIQINLDEVRVFPKRALENIQKDIQSLGYNERDYVLGGIDAMQSPLTYLYSQVSRKERMKRRAYEIINADRKRDLLKELLVEYVDNDIIDLQPDEYEDFVEYINIPDHILRSMSQYEFIIFTKRRFKAYRNDPPVLRQDLDTHD